MSSPESEVQHPKWEGAAVGFLHAIERGLIPPEKIAMAAGQVCTNLVRGGLAANFGELQTYLRQREAVVQLIAHPFNPEEMSRPTRCLDVISNQPRSHYLWVSVGAEDVAAQLQTLQMSHEVNETLLAQHTGMLVV